MAFQYSGRKEDISMKLRAQNMKSAQKETKSLERDSKKMEERLQELKLAMLQEKEQRERGGHEGFWSRGQEGNLGNYASDVLKKPAKNKANKEARRKVRVLKDEPTVLPERQAGPGTLGFIAKRANNSANREKIKGPKCGQCEEKGAHVSCLECGEDYCAGCFAAFHLKGALKKHRSVPLGQSGMRTPRGGVIGGGDIGGLTPRAPPPRTDDVRATPTDVELLVGSTPSSVRSTPRHSARAGNDVSLLEGHYDEAEAAADFQRALAEWRLGKQANGSAASPASPSPSSSGPREKTLQPKTRVNAAAHQRSSTHTVEEGTCMEDFEGFAQKPIEIKFHSNLTYAERLMLKRARRTELGTAAPSVGSVSAQGSRSDSAALEKNGPSKGAYDNSPRSAVSYSEVEILNEGAIAMAELMETESSRVDFGSLFGAVNRPSDHYDDQPIRSESRVSIIELAESVPRRSLRGVEQTSSYEVTEVKDGEEFTPPEPSSLAIHHNANVSGRHNFTPPSSASHSARRKRAQGQTMTFEGQVESHNTAKSARNRSAATKQGRDLGGEAVGGETALTPRPSARHSAGRSSRDDVERLATVGSVTLSQAALASGRQSPRQAPPSARMTSARGQKSRPGSRSAARPQSRAKSRAESRMSMFGEGNITKEPSEALKQIALLSREITSQIVSDTQSRLGLGDFFTAGVESTPPGQDVERTLTPTKNRPTSARPMSSRPKLAKQQENQIEKWKISNKLYSMTPRSWKPDFSLADTVPDAQAERHIQDTAGFELTATQYDGTLMGSEDRMAEEVALASVQRLQASVEETKPRTPISSRPKSRGTWGPPQPLSRPPTRPSSAVQRPLSSRRESSRIVMEGEDLSMYDTRGEESHQSLDDSETLDRLEWELASQTGRLTADGRVSRMLDDADEFDERPLSTAELREHCYPGDEGIDINNQLRESELMDDFEEMEKAINDEQDVKQLL